MKNQLLLLQDVKKLGRKGDLVIAKPGFARNFLLPQKIAVFADKSTLRMRARLQEERAKQADVDRREAESLASRIIGMVLTSEVKVDPLGHMYGSVTALDIVHLFAKEGIQLEKSNVALPQPIKRIGVYDLHLELKEDVRAPFQLKVISEAGAEVLPPPPAEKKKEGEASAEEEAPAEEEQKDEDVPPTEAKEEEPTEE